jgi:drug/metabolite transporter (DMT)-like permease
MNHELEEADWRIRSAQLGSGNRGVSYHMDRMNLQALTVAAICILLAVGAQTLLKLAIVRSGGMPVLEIGIAGLVRKFLAVPYIFLAFGLYGLSAVLWLQVLTKVDFSVAFPMVSMTYVGTLFIGRFVFNEPVNLFRIVGVLLICSGVLFVIRSQ